MAKYLDFRAKGIFLGVITFALAVLVYVAPIPVQAATQIVDGVRWTYVVFNGEATIGDGEDAAISTSIRSFVSIPSSLGGFPVVAIAPGAFSDCDIREVWIPGTVRTIAISAFWCSYRLQAFYVSDSNPWFAAEDGVLFTRDGRRLIAYPPSRTGSHYSVPRGVKIVDSCAFYGNRNLVSISIPPETEELHWFTFQFNFKLERIDVDYRNTAYMSIDGTLFTKDGRQLIVCPKPSSDFVVPYGVEQIGPSAFDMVFNSYLRSVTIPNSVRSIGDGAFSGCGNLESVTIGTGVSSIGNGAFYGCGSLTSVTIPHSVTSIGNYVFDGCDNLQTLFLPYWLLGAAQALGVPESCNVINADVCIYDFLTRLYQLCLGRNPDQAGIDGWWEWLAFGRIDGANAALGFFTSAEMVNRNLSNEEYLEILYMAMMNRPSDYGGRAYWLGALEGGVSRVGVFRGFAESAEFTAICDAFGIVRGSIDPATLENRDLNVGVTEFVARCYTKALGRGYDVGGLNGWCGYILTSPNPKAAAIWVSTEGFFGSAEFQRRNLPDTAFIEVCYQTFLGRGSDPGGLAFWLGQMAGGMGRNAVLQGFASSAEFNAIMGMYGL